jgi:hypothetical protein
MWVMIGVVWCVEPARGLRTDDREDVAFAAVVVEVLLPGQADDRR